MPDKNITSNYSALKKPYIFAHRGSSAIAPENTISAFKVAVDQHADGVELDVKLTADNEVIVMHDDTVDRTTNGTGRIKSLTLLDLQKLDAGSKFNLAYKMEKIPTLAEVFEAIGQQIFINVELTNYSSPMDDLPDRVAVVVKKYHMEAKVLLSSFNIYALIRAHYLLPEVPIGLLVFQGSASVILQSRLIRLGPMVALHPDYLDVTPDLIKKTHQARSRIHTYTVNEADVMHRLFSIGVDGIFTDDPLLAQKILQQDN